MITVRAIDHGFLLNYHYLEESSNDDFCQSGDENECGAQNR
jgi:hypothetical protein